MGIQRCENCGTKFNYIDLQKSLWSGYKPINCRDCLAKHNLKMPYRFVFVIPTVLPVFFKHIISGLAPTMTLLILIYIAYVAVIASLCPFIFRYSLRKNED